MSGEQYVVVVGASGVDIKASVRSPLEGGVSNTGTVRYMVGGVARNIAENLARLEVPTVLLSAVGQDSSGQLLLSRTKQAGVDVQQVLQLPETNTGSYVALFDENGQLAVAVSDFDIIEAISPAYVWEKRSLFADAAMVVIDANLSPKTLDSLFRMARRYKLPVCADPTSLGLASKLLTYLDDLYMVAPDAHEAATLCGGIRPPANSEEAIATAQCLVNQGVDIAIVTLAEQGLAYAGEGGSGHIPALRTNVVDATGVGDALTAAVIFGLLNEMSLDEAMRLGVSAASLTLRSRETVVPDLSLDRLYDALVV